MKTRQGNCFLGMAAGALLLGSTLSSVVFAADADTYNGTISFKNLTGVSLSVPGCHAISRDDNSCTPEVGSVVSGATGLAAKMKSHEHSPEGTLTVLAQDVAGHNLLSYKFDKNQGDSNLVFTKTAEGPATLAIDSDQCTESPDQTGVLKCCTFKHKKHHFHHEYTYTCELPVVPVN